MPHIVTWVASAIIMATVSAASGAAPWMTGTNTLRKSLVE